MNFSAERWTASVRGNTRSVRGNTRRSAIFQTSEYQLGFYITGFRTPISNSPKSSSDVSAGQEPSTMTMTVRCHYYCYFHDNAPRYCTGRSGTGDWNVSQITPTRTGNLKQNIYTATTRLQWWLGSSYQPRPTINQVVEQHCTGLFRREWFPSSYSYFQY